jgi:hypothetical protein
MTLRVNQSRPRTGHVVRRVNRTMALPMLEGAKHRKRLEGRYASPCRAPVLLPDVRELPAGLSQPGHRAVVVRNRTRVRGGMQWGASEQQYVGGSRGRGRLRSLDADQPEFRALSRHTARQLADPVRSGAHETWLCYRRVGFANALGRVGLRGLGRSSLGGRNCNRTQPVDEDGRSEA